MVEVATGKKFQYGGRKSVTTLNTKPEVVLRYHNCDLEIAYYVITLPWMARLGRNLVK